MDFPALRRSLAWFAAVALYGAGGAQTVHVDVTASKAIPSIRIRPWVRHLDILANQGLRQDLQRANHQGEFVGGMGTDHLPSEYGINVRHVALEPERDVERRRTQERIFRGNAEPKDFLRESSDIAWRTGEQPAATPGSLSLRE